MKLDMKQFEPKKLELMSLHDKYQPLVETKINDKNGLEIIKKARIVLKSARVDVAKFGKAMRDDANKFSKDVKAKADEYILLISPLEEELKQKEDEYIKQQAIERRKEELPERKFMLEWLAIMTDDEILAMDNVQFSQRLFALQQTKLRADQEKLKEKEEAIRLEEEKRQAKADREKEIEEAKIAATKQAEEKAQAQIAQLKKDAEDKENKRVADEKREADAELKRLKEQKEDEKYQAYLTLNNYNEKTDVIIDWSIYRKIASYTK